MRLGGPRYVRTTEEGKRGGEFGRKWKPRENKRGGDNRGRERAVEDIRG
jgi:hypothetical protein